MSIESDLNRIASALEAIANAMTVKTEITLVHGTEAVAPEKPKTRKPKAAAEPAPAAEPAAPAVAEPAPAAEPAAPAVAAVTYEQLRAAGTKVITLGKAAELKAILGEFGVEKLSQLQKEQYAAVLAKLNTLAA